MKLRISGKDLIYFLFFAILLFYLCAIATSNIHSFSVDGTFTGLNPISGLTDFLSATVILFIILLIIVFSSVTSYIFERKKGIGFEIGEKENKGYSRWAKEREIKNDKDVEVVDPLQQESKYAGIPLVNDGKKLWVDNGEYHNLVIGATGSGKSQTCVEPMVELLIKKGESMIITDPKGELYKAASDYLRERGYNVIVLNFREPQRGNAWNPLTLPYQYFKDGNIDKATELLDDVALNILYDPNNKGEPFWEKSAADYFSGLTLGLFEDAKIEQINLNSINYMSTLGEDKFAAGTYVKEYFTMKGESSNAYVFASNTINAPNDTKGGILSVFRQKIRLFSSRENLSEMLSYSDFDMRDIGKQKTAVFIDIHDEKTTYHSLATIFIKQCYETLIDVAQAHGGKLPYRTNFILDEFANMPPLKDVTTMVTAARSRFIRFTFIIQNFAQLKSVYGNEDAETIKGNCGNLIYLISTELAALEEISKMCGEVKSSDKDKTASTPLVTVSDLQKLKLFEAIIIRWRMSPFKTKYTPNFKMDWGHKKSEAEFPVREKKNIQLFDIKEYVKEKKRQNMLNSLDSNNTPGVSLPPTNSGFNPFPNMGANPTNPFATPPTTDNNGMFGSGMNNELDLDAMMRDIDRKIAELDAEEARQKEELEKKKKEEKASLNSTTDSVKNDITGLEDTKELSPIQDLNFDNLAKIDLPSFDNKANLEMPEKKEQLNLYDEIEKNNNLTKEVEEIKGVSLGNDKVNVAVATGSPDEENDFEFGELPKVENADVLQPNYIGSGVIKASEDETFNIYNTIPESMKNLTVELSEDSKIKNNTVKDAVIEEVKNIKEDVNEIKEVAEEIKDNANDLINDDQDMHVNIKPEDVVVNNNVISDDEFFDDFFGDD